MSRDTCQASRVMSQEHLSGGSVLVGEKGSVLIANLPLNFPPWLAGLGAVRVIVVRPFESGGNV